MRQLGSALDNQKPARFSSNAIGTTLEMVERCQDIFGISVLLFAAEEGQRRRFGSVRQFCCESALDFQTLESKTFAWNARSDEDYSPIDVDYFGLFG